MEVMIAHSASLLGYVQFPERERDCCLVQSARTGSGNSAPCSSGTGASFPGIKQLEGKTFSNLHLLPIEVCVYLHDLMAYKGTILPLPSSLLNYNGKFIKFYGRCSEIIVEMKVIV
jgi:hypothetical protein